MHVELAALHIFVRRKKLEISKLLQIETWRRYCNIWKVVSLQIGVIKGCDLNGNQTMI